MSISTVGAATLALHTARLPFEAGAASVTTQAQAARKLADQQNNGFVVKPSPAQFAATQTAAAAHTAVGQTVGGLNTFA
jgi:hypothetical protein